MNVQSNDHSKKSYERQLKQIITTHHTEILNHKHIFKSKIYPWPYLCVCAETVEDFYNVPCFADEACSVGALSGAAPARPRVSSYEAEDLKKEPATVDIDARNQEEDRNTETAMVFDARIQEEVRNIEPAMIIDARNQEN